MKIGGNSGISARISVSIVSNHRIYNAYTGVITISCQPCNPGENVGRLVVAARNIYSKNYGSCISVHSSRQVPRRCIGGSYTRDAVRYVKAEHVNEFIRARRLFFALPPLPSPSSLSLSFFFSTGIASKPLQRKKQLECCVIYFYLISRFVGSRPVKVKLISTREKSN